ncbi:MAG TPA: LysR family transcriptional regulator, partial [Rhizobiaceae bacterium]|nr:LysR family transcriptional regulator [Rhizobiaceae bacterium]
SLGIAQPTVQKAINQLERDAACPLFDRTSHGMLATRECQSLANAARLAFVELAQAEADLAEYSGREVGTIVVGALPFSLSYLLPVIATRFREKRPQMSVKVVHMPFFQLLAGLRRGEIDFLLGGLSDAAPDADIDQKTLFQDSLVLLARSDHPVTRKLSPALEELAAYPWVVAPKSTPAHNYFEQLFAGVGEKISVSIVDTCSFELMRELLATSDHLGCISMLQAAREVERGNLKRLKVEAAQATWPIGVTTRSGWLATASQREFLEIVAAVANDPFANSVSL